MRSRSARDGPDDDLGGAGAAEDGGDGVGGGAGGEDVIDDDPAGAVEVERARRGEGAANVGGAFLAREMGLGFGGKGSLDEVGMDREGERRGEDAGEAFGLVELAFALPDRVERDGDDAGPWGGCDVGEGRGEPDVGEEGLEPEGALILVEVDGAACGANGLDGGAGA